MDMLLTGVKTVLGPHLVGAYLTGSLATGDLDEHSDIDFVLVTEDPIDTDTVATPQAVHDRVRAGRPRWGPQPEGSLVPGMRCAATSPGSGRPDRKAGTRPRRPDARFFPLAETRAQAGFYRLRSTLPLRECVSLPSSIAAVPLTNTQ